MLTAAVSSATSTGFVSMLPPMQGWQLPAPQFDGLSDDEQRLVTGLSERLTFQSNHAQTHWLYYDAEQLATNLGVLVPQQLASIRTVAGWARRVVDAPWQRSNVDGFRLPAQTDVDTELQAHWTANDLDSEYKLAQLDALVTGRGYLIIGSPDTPGDSPLVTVESPSNLSVQWNTRARRVSAAFQSYEEEGVFRAALYLPNVSIYMSRDSTSAASTWAVDNRDQHNLGVVPVVRIPNRARSSDRQGRSEISTAIKSHVDSASRTLLGMEVAREFYSIPHKFGLGLSESDFVDAAGNPKTGLDMSASKFLAFERDEKGNIPTVGQFVAMDPSVFTKIIDKYGTLMSGETGYDPSMFGVTTATNPSSADAIRVADHPLERRADLLNLEQTAPLRQAAQLIWRMANKGQALPDELKRLAVDWRSTKIPTPAATADAMFKQAQMGAVPATSDVVLSELGWDALQRERLAQDRAVDAGASVLAELANSLQAREARADTTVAHDILGKTTPSPASGTPAPVTSESQPGQSGR